MAQSIENVTPIKPKKKARKPNYKLIDEANARADKWQQVAYLEGTIIAFGVLVVGVIQMSNLTG